MAVPDFLDGDLSSPAIMIVTSSLPKCTLYIRPALDQKLMNNGIPSRPEKRENIRARCPLQPPNCGPEFKALWWVQYEMHVLRHKHIREKAHSLSRAPSVHAFGQDTIGA